MRRIVVSEFMSLDGVMQAPGGPEEDTEGAFATGDCMGSMAWPISRRPCGSTVRR